MGGESIIDAHVALGVEHHLRLDARGLIERMDRSDVSMAIARPLGAEVAVNNRAGNDRALRRG